jgi:hypothetical protein
VGRGRGPDVAVVCEWVQHEPVSLGGESEKQAPHPTDGGHA